MQHNNHKKRQLTLSTYTGYMFSTSLMEFWVSKNFWPIRLLVGRL